MQEPHQTEIASKPEVSPVKSPAPPEVSLVKPNSQNPEGNTQATLR